MDQIQQAVLNLAIVSATGFLGYLASQVGGYFRSKGLINKFESKRDSISIAVKAVEQIAKNEGIPDKFEAAKAKAIELISANGFEITEGELDLMIEDAVVEMNRKFKLGGGFQ